MTNESAERYRTVAAGFTRRVDAVHGDAWSLPAPCAEWMADAVARTVEEAGAWAVTLTPTSIRLRKMLLNENDRRKAGRRRA